MYAVARYSHALLVLKDYERMPKYIEDKELIRVVFISLKQYTPIDDSSFTFDVISHSYTVALLSQCVHQREEILWLSHNTADNVLEANVKGYRRVLYRSMKVLMKTYPALVE